MKNILAILLLSVMTFCVGGVYHSDTAGSHQLVIEKQDIVTHVDESVNAVNVLQMDELVFEADETPFTVYERSVPTEATISINDPPDFTQVALIDYHLRC